MRELYLKSLELTGEEGNPRRFDYYIIIDEMNVGSYACESYGVKIMEQGGEAAIAPHVTCSISRIDELSQLLLDNQVTPASLMDVVCDWM